MFWSVLIALSPSPPSPPPPSYMITLPFLSLSIDIDHVRGEHAIQVLRTCACHAEFTHESIITRCSSVFLLGFVLIVIIVTVVSRMTPITVMRENGFFIKRTATTHTYSFPWPSSSLPPPSVALLGWRLLGWRLLVAAMVTPCPERVKSKSTDDWVDAPWWHFDSKWECWKCVICDKYNKKDAHLRGKTHQEMMSSKRWKWEHVYTDVKVDTVEQRYCTWGASDGGQEDADGSQEDGGWWKWDGKWEKERRSWRQRKGIGDAPAAAEAEDSSLKPAAAEFFAAAAAACPGALQQSDGNHLGGPAAATAEPSHQGGAATAEQGIQHRSQAPADEAPPADPDRTPDRGVICGT